MDNNPDLRAAGFNHQLAQQHFDVYGHGEGRRSSPVNSSFVPVYRSYFTLINSTDTSGTTNGLDPISSIADPGNTLRTAYNVNALSNEQSFSQNVSPSDLNDYYRFSLSDTREFNLMMNGMNRDADVQLIEDINNDGSVDSGEVIDSSTAGSTAVESIRRTLDAGTYYIRVYPFSSGVDINYTLTISAS